MGTSAARNAAGARYPWSVRLKALLPLWLPWARSASRCRGRRERRSGRSVRARSIGARAPTSAPSRTRHVRPHETGHVAETPHPPADRSLGRARAGLYRDRFGRAFRGPRRRRVSPLAECDGHPHDLGRNPARSWARARCACRQALEQIRQALPFALRGIDSDNGSEFINDHLHALLQGAADSVHARAGPTRKTTTRTSSRRTGRTCASSATRAWTMKDPAKEIIGVVDYLGMPQPDRERAHAEHQGWLGATSRKSTWTTAT